MRTLPHSTPGQRSAETTVTCISCKNLHPAKNANERHMVKACIEAVKKQLRIWMKLRQSGSAKQCMESVVVTWRNQVVAAQPVLWTIYIAWRRVEVQWFRSQRAPCYCANEVLTCVLWFLDVLNFKQNMRQYISDGVHRLLQGNSLCYLVALPMSTFLVVSSLTGVRIYGVLT